MQEYFLYNYESSVRNYKSFKIPFILTLHKNYFYILLSLDKLTSAVDFFLLKVKSLRPLFFDF